MGNFVSTSEHLAIVAAIKENLKSRPGLTLVFPLEGSQQGIFQLLIEDSELVTSYHFDIFNTFSVSLKNVAGSDVLVVDEKFDVSKKTTLKWCATKDLMHIRDRWCEFFHGKIQLMNGNTVVLDWNLDEKSFFTVCDNFGYKDFKQDEDIEQNEYNKNIYSYKGEGPVTRGPRLVRKDVQCVKKDEQSMLCWVCSLIGWK